MEAPEKIYVKINHPFRGVTEIIGFEHGSGIEYTRTDAFIEKATSYIQQHWIWNTKMIDDFVNYMKGE